jgi:hypothetical protein
VEGRAILEGVIRGRRFGGGALLVNSGLLSLEPAKARNIGRPQKPLIQAYGEAFTF